MKHVDPRRLQAEAHKNKRAEENLYLAVHKHKLMKKYFKGIYSYRTRKILFRIGQNHGK